MQRPNEYSNLFGHYDPSRNNVSSQTRNRYGILGNFVPNALLSIVDPMLTEEQKKEEQKKEEQKKEQEKELRRIEKTQEEIVIEFKDIIFNIIPEILSFLSSLIGFAQDCEFFKFDDDSDSICSILIKISNVLERIVNCLSEESPSDSMYIGLMGELETYIDQLIPKIEIILEELREHLTYLKNNKKDYLVETGTLIAGATATFSVITAAAVKFKKELGVILANVQVATAIVIVGVIVFALAKHWYNKPGLEKAIKYHTEFRNKLHELSSKIAKVRLIILLGVITNTENYIKNNQYKDMLTVQWMKLKIDIDKFRFYFCNCAASGK